MAVVINKQLFTGYHSYQSYRMYCLLIGLLSVCSVTSYSDIRDPNRANSDASGLVNNRGSDRDTHQVSAEEIDSNYFLHRLLDKYGDGTQISVGQVQALLDQVASEHKPEHADTGRAKRATDIHAGNHGDQANLSCYQSEDWIHSQHCLDSKCLSAQDVFLFHDVDSSKANSTEFFMMSPTLLYTAQNTDCSKDLVSKKSPPTLAEVWGYSFLCVTIINLCSITGMVFLPLMQKSFYKRLLMFMVALAVGTLSGSSLLFLLPECFDMTSEENPDYEDYVWKCTTVIGGIYMFFLVERVLKNVMDWKKKHGEKPPEIQDALPGTLKTRDIHLSESINMSFSIPQSPKDRRRRHTSSTSCKCDSSRTAHQSENGGLVANSDHQANDKVDEGLMVVPPGSATCTCDVAAVPAVDSLPLQPSSEVAPNYTKIPTSDSAASFSFLRPNVSAAQLLQRTPDSCVETLPPTQMKQEIKSVAWMVIIGDGLHNFIDGLSIGAAFSKNTLAGVSISLAVVCEELPHELGDFAILLNSGMSMRQALSYNFLSACMCYLGLVVGIVVGEMTAGSTWIFALAAGMFLYISLVDMLPEVNHAAEEVSKETGHVWRVFFLQNTGLLMGYAIMLLMAIYSKDIQF